MDSINGCLGALGSLFVLLNIFQLYVDKEVKGVSTVYILFFWFWSAFNVFYFRHLGEGLSVAGATCLFIANTLWLGQILYYRIMQAEVLYGIMISYQIECGKHSCQFDDSESMSVAAYFATAVSYKYTNNLLEDMLNHMKKTQVTLTYDSKISRFVFRQGVKECT